MADGLFRTKSVKGAEEHAPEHRLAATLSWPHLIALGIGAIVGTGILTLIGVGAGKAGPAVILSFVIAGAICAAAALAYAEMSTMMPASGSAYSYSYAVLGEIIAWVVGWSLILEYSLVVSAVAVGWSGYAAPLLQSWAGVPMELMQGPKVEGELFKGTMEIVRSGINLPAIFIIAVVAGLLSFGTKESATLNAGLVVVKIVALSVFVAVALPYLDTANFDPFAPFGFAKHSIIGANGKAVEVGVMAAAAIIFFAFYGFDAISTAAEEAKNPGRDLAIGIVGSMAACAAIYMLVGVAAVGVVSYTRFADSPEPLALILRELGQPKFATFLAVSAIIALPTVILGFLFGQSRIFFTMARDGMLPIALAKVSSRGAPVRITIFTAVIVSVIAGLLPIDEIAALANAGTLVAFAAVAICMMVLRRRAPDAPRMFRTPLWWLVGTIAVVGCAYLFVSLPSKTQMYFLIWNVLGLVIYFAYARPKVSKQGLA